MKNLIKKSSIGLLEYKNYRVSPDGSYIEKNGSMLTIQTDPDGYKYAYDGFDNVYIDELIARAYGLRFRGRGGYYIAHKDGNLENYDRANLEWRAVSETVRTTAGHVYFDDYTVGKDGSYFKTNGKTIEKGQRSDCWDDARKITFFKNPVVATVTIQQSRVSCNLTDGSVKIVVYSDIWRLAPTCLKGLKMHAYR